MVDTRSSHDHDCGVARVWFERSSQTGVRGEVECRERVVEHIDLGVGHERPGDRQPLPLTARHVRATLLDATPQPIRHRLHKTVGLSDLERLPQLVVGGIGTAEAEIGRDRSGEQERLLRHVADLAPQQIGVEVADIDPIDEHLAAARVEQPGDQVDQRRLAGTGAADDRRGLTGGDAKADPPHSTGSWAPA